MTVVCISVGVQHRRIESFLDDRVRGTLKGMNTEGSGSSDIDAIGCADTLVSGGICFSKIEFLLGECVDPLSSLDPPLKTKQQKQSRKREVTYWRFADWVVEAAAHWSAIKHFVMEMPIGLTAKSARPPTDPDPPSLMAQTTMEAFVVHTAPPSAPLPPSSSSSSIAPLLCCQSCRASLDQLQSHLKCICCTFFCSKL